MNLTEKQNRTVQVGQEGVGKVKAEKIRSYNAKETTRQNNFMAC